MNLIASIDQGTSSTRVIVFEAGKINVIASHQVQVKQSCPQEGWMEQDAMELWNSVEECINAVSKQLDKSAIRISDIKGVGLTNQRESTILWDRFTGEPLCPSIVWCDARNGQLVKELCDEFGQDFLRDKTGLPLATYFSATKLLWLMKNNPKVKEGIENKSVLFGTVDSWILWKLTGGIQGGVHLTDVTNASRTLLMNINTLTWDQELLKFFNVPDHILPGIKPSSDTFGVVKTGQFAGISVTGIIGDQQAALLGHGCTNKGEAKSTYGTGCFLLYNTGDEMVKSEHGLLTTVAYQCAGRDANYALEGSVAVAGSAVRWLQNNLGIIKTSSEISELASQVESTDGVYFVPAFSGLFAPYWKPDARGVLCGLTAHSTKHHIARSVLEATCFQVMDIFQAMRKDSKSDLRHVLVDGGMTSSEVMLQYQADIAGVNVSCPRFKEITAVGAAVAAGATLNLWNLGQKMEEIATYKPKISDELREMKMKKWKMAVERSLGWETQ